MGEKRYNLLVKFSTAPPLKLVFPAGRRVHGKLVIVTGWISNSGLHWDIGLIRRGKEWREFTGIFRELVRVMEYYPQLPFSDMEGKNVLNIDTADEVRKHFMEMGMRAAEYLPEPERSNEAIILNTTADGVTVSYGRLWDYYVPAIKVYEIVDSKDWREVKIELYRVHIPQPLYERLYFTTKSVFEMKGFIGMLDIPDEVVEGSMSTLRVKIQAAIINARGALTLRILKRDGRKLLEKSLDSGFWMALERRVDYSDP